ncbi:MAG: polysaccharide deacetylase family protein [Rhodospirillales bacterium]|nr:polysaccharide deacetylase family protein [Rhodospirillales bacterium]
MYIRRLIKNTLCALLAGLAVLGGIAGEATADANAVVIMYHRFGESRYPSTNVTIKQFDAHLEELSTGGYTVMALPDIIKAMRSGQALPERTVGISIDDAYLSVYTEAWPRLKAAGFPFTIFVATDPVDQNTHDFMTWAQVREMAEAGVTVAAHTGSHLHMPKASQARNLDELARSKKRVQEMLGQTPEIFAYPYGESSLGVQAMAKDAGFIAAFGQHSGAFNAGAEMFDLPRFAMNENYAGMARFRLAANALALPVMDLTPTDPLIKTHNPPAMGFTLTRDIKGIERLSCFAAHEGSAKLERLGQRRIEVRVETPFPKGRTRVNCTQPGPDGRWYWFGRQFYRPE